MNISPSKVANFSRVSAQSTVFQIVLVLVVIALCYSYLVQPKTKELASRKEQYRKLEEQNKEMERQKRVMDTLVAKLNNSTESLETLDETLPLDPKTSRLYILLDNMTKSAGLSTANIFVDASSTVVVAGDKALLASPYGQDRAMVTIPITISSRGSLAQLNNLLTLMETSSRLLDVTSIDITGDTDGQLTFRVLLKSYVYSPGEAAKTAVSTPLAPGASGQDPNAVGRYNK